MPFRHTTLLLVATLALTLGACSREQAATPPAPATPATAETSAAPAPSPYELVSAGGKGFTVGPMMAANPVYVLFDPQCPHCGHLWQAAQPLLGTVKFVWLPVAIMNGKSLPQGGALLQASDPVKAMSDHERALLDGKGGMSASANVPEDLAHGIKVNSMLLDRLGADSVPFIVARHAATGQPVTHSGALGTEELRTFLGVNKP